MLIPDKLKLRVIRLSNLWNEKLLSRIARHWKAANFSIALMSFGARWPRFVFFLSDQPPVVIKERKVGQAEVGAARYSFTFCSHLDSSRGRTAEKFTLDEKCMSTASFAVCRNRMELLRNKIVDLARLFCFGCFVMHDWALFGEKKRKCRDVMQIMLRGRKSIPNLWNTLTHIRNQLKQNNNEIVP